MGLRSRYKSYRQRRKLHREYRRNSGGSRSFMSKKMMKWLFIIAGVAILWFGFLKDKIKNT